MNLKAVVDPVETHQVAEFKHQNPLTTLRVDPTSRFVAAGAQDLDVQLWNLEDGNRLHADGTQELGSIDRFLR